MDVGVKSLCTWTWTCRPGPLASCSCVGGLVCCEKLVVGTTLRRELELAGSSHDWAHVTDQIGMFAFTGMTTEMCDEP